MIENSEVAFLTSSITHREYKLFVGMPDGYGESDSSHPVIYALDGNSLFPALTNITRILAYFDQIPKTIVVGIGSPTLEEMFEQRRIDYNPADEGTKLFLQVLRQEIIPLIEREYSTRSGDRALIGHSAGGFFGLYALLHQPPTFQRYILGSPPLLWEECVALSYEADYAASQDDLRANVFMFFGSLERFDEAGNLDGRVPAMDEMERRLNNRGYPGLNLCTHVFEEENHVSVLPTALSRALRFVFRLE
jgi:predicted alpha/beta superfamily hydrolase